MAAAALLAGAGCSSSHPAARATTTTTLITADTWSPPSVSGPPSPAGFCRLLVAVYRHEGTLPEAANLKIREDIVGDYVLAAPKVVAAAPASIAAAARLYINGVANALAALDRVGLDSRKLQPGQIGVDLLSPQMQEASNVVLAYSKSQCHYTIGG